MIWGKQMKFLKILLKSKKKILSILKHEQLKIVQNIDNGYFQATHTHVWRPT